MASSSAVTTSPAQPDGRLPHRHLSLWVVTLLVFTLALAGAVEAKRRGPIQPPELRIVTVTIEPIPYRPADGTLQLTVEVELPADLGLKSVLEVSSLITSPSKRSMRFLVNRQPLDPATLLRTSTTAGGIEGKPRLEVTLVWDGTDQSKQFVSDGRYDYEVRAKLLLASDDGPPRTHMVSWRKIGMITVGAP